MEALGGDRLWFDRFLAYHASIVYYWVLVSAPDPDGLLILDRVAHILRSIREGGLTCW